MSSISTNPMAIVRSAYVNVFNYRVLAMLLVFFITLDSPLVLFANLCQICIELVRPRDTSLELLHLLIDLNVLSSLRPDHHWLLAARILSGTCLSKAKPAWLEEPILLFLLTRIWILDAWLIPSDNVLLLTEVALPVIACAYHSKLHEILTNHYLFLAGLICALLSLLDSETGLQGVRWMFYGIGFGSGCEEWLFQPNSVFHSICSKSSSWKKWVFPSALVLLAQWCPFAVFAFLMRLYALVRLFQDGIESSGNAQQLVGWIQSLTSLALPGSENAQNK